MFVAHHAGPLYAHFGGRANCLVWQHGRLSARILEDGQIGWFTLRLSPFTSRSARASVVIDFSFGAHRVEHVRLETKFPAISFVHLFVHSLLHSFVRLFVCSFVR